MSNKYFVPKPVMFDFGTLSIMIPVLVSAVGLFLMSVEAMVFVQFASLEQDTVRLYVSVISAFCMAFGGEVGTVSNTVEIFRKYIRSKVYAKFEWDIITRWDYLGLVVSASSTLLAMVIAASTRPKSNTSWAAFISEWLIIPFMIVAVGDVYSGVIELGLRLGTFELRMREWLVRNQEYNEQIAHNARLVESNQQTKVMDNLKCWCGTILNSFDDYSHHLNVHKAQATKFKSAEDAHNYFQEIAIFDSHFAIPDVEEIAKWKS